MYCPTSCFGYAGKCCAVAVLSFRTAVWEDLPECLRDAAKEVTEMLFGSAVEDTPSLRVAGEQYWRELTQACTGRVWDFKLIRAGT